MHAAAWSRNRTPGYDALVTGCWLCRSVSAGMAVLLQAVHVVSPTFPADAISTAQPQDQTQLRFSASAVIAPSCTRCQQCAADIAADTAATVAATAAVAERCPPKRGTHQAPKPGGPRWAHTNQRGPYSVGQCQLGEPSRVGPRHTAVWEAVDGLQSKPAGYDRPRGGLRRCHTAA